MPVSQKESTKKKSSDGKKKGKKRSLSTAQIQELDPTDIVLSPIRRPPRLYTFPYEATQGEKSLANLVEEHKPIKIEIMTRRPPSKKKGMWFLDTGDWACREGAEFFKGQDGEWYEIRRDAARATDKIGKGPAKQGRKENLETDGQPID